MFCLLYFPTHKKGIYEWDVYYRENHMSRRGVQLIPILELLRNFREPLLFLD